MTVVVVTRPRETFAAATAEVERMGWVSIGAPMVEVHPRGREAIERFEQESARGAFDWVVLASANGVRAIDEADDRFLSRLRAPTVAVGEKTAKALRAKGLRPEVPDLHSSKGVLDLLAPRVRGRRVALLRSDQGARDVVDGLALAGASVVDIVAYEVGLPSDLSDATRLVQTVANQGADAFTFTSRNGVLNFLEIARQNGVEEDVETALSRGVVGALGDPTRRALEDRGFEVHAVPEHASFRRLLEAVRKALR